MGRRHGAVGGVVAEEGAQVLLLERRVLREGQWVSEVRLPKGPLQPRETDADSALAEVRRLTGFEDLEVLADLGRAPVSYVHRGVRYRRQEHFFLMRLRSRMRSRRVDAAAEMYSHRFVPGFAEAAEQLSFASEQSAVLRARAWWPT